MAASVYNPTPVREQISLGRAANAVTGAAGAAASITYAADAARSHSIAGFILSFSAAPAAGTTVSVTVAGVTVFSSHADIGPREYPARISGGVNEALVITFSAPGGAVVGKLNILGHINQNGAAQCADA